MSAAPKPNLLLDALAEPAALLDPGTLRVLFANHLLLERAPEAVGALPPFAWWPGEAAEALEECRRLSGAQFDADAVAALESVLALGSEERYPSRWGPSGS